MQVDKLRDLIKHTKNLNVLYVEDNIEVQTQTAKMLQSFFNDICIANNGKIGDTQVVSSDYIRMATDYSLHEEAFKPGRATNYFGYGFQTWVFPLKSRSFAMLGIYGQSIFIQSDSGVVMVETSVNDLPMDVESMRKKIMIWFAILAALGGQTEKLDLKNNFNSVRKSH